MEQIRIALLGCGTVGTGVLKLLHSNAGDIRARLGAELLVQHVVVRDPDRERDPHVDPALLTTDVDRALDDPDVAVVVELIGGYEPARSHVLAAIAKGKHVVTANKALLAQHGAEVFAAAEAAGVDIAFEAAVAGGIPIIRSLREGLASDRVERIWGIINGTSNYILTEMAERGRAYADVLAEAQRLGYAEADPSMDVDGIDAAQKLSILISLAFGVSIPFEEMAAESLATLLPADFAFAERFGYAIKPLAIAKNDSDGLEARVHPTMIPKTHLLASVCGVFNAVALETTAVGPLLFSGRGAGMMPTAVSVLSDIIEVARSIQQGTSGRVPHLAWRHHQRQTRRKPLADIVCEYYLRFTVLDRPGVLSVLAGVLGENHISIRQLVQPDAEEGQPVHVVMLTHLAREGDVRKALQRIDAQSSTAAPTLHLRIENPA